MSASYDVVIAGAGPVGLSLALGLGRAGRSVLIIEKNEGFSQYSRALVVWPKTSEILNRLGVLEDFRQNSMTPDAFNVWDADADRPLIQLPFYELKHHTAFPEPLILPQSKTEQLLYESLSDEPSVDIRFGYELESFETASDDVSLIIRNGQNRHTCRAQYLAGCDGAHSAVREQLGFNLSGSTYAAKACLADVCIKESECFTFPRISNAAGMAVAIRFQTDTWRLIMPFGAEQSMDADTQIELCMKHLFPEIAYSVVWKSEFKLHRRIASQFVSNRVVLAGDAAHLNSPVGGEGMNAGIQDTELLSQCLIQALEKNDPSALSDYGQKRQAAVGGQVNRFTDTLTRIILFKKGRFVKMIFRLAALVMKIPVLRRKFLLRLTMLR